MTEEKTGLTRDQIEAIAAGLYYVAATDGVDEREVAVIRDFLREVGAPELLDRLAELHFDPAEAAKVLGTEWLRSVFLKAAILVVRGDGVVSAAERRALAWISRHFGVRASLEELERSVAGTKI
jgi:tellurite resistance protein